MLHLLQKLVIVQEHIFLNDFFWIQKLRLLICDLLLDDHTRVALPKVVLDTISTVTRLTLHVRTVL